MASCPLQRQRAACRKNNLNSPANTTLWHGVTLAAELRRNCRLVTSICKPNKIKNRAENSSCNEHHQCIPEGHLPPTCTLSSWMNKPGLVCMSCLHMDPSRCWRGCLNDCRCQNLPRVCQMCKGRPAAQGADRNDKQETAEAWMLACQLKRHDWASEDFFIANRRKMAYDFMWKGSRSVTHLKHS